MEISFCIPYCYFFGETLFLGLPPKNREIQGARRKVTAKIRDAKFNTPVKKTPEVVMSKNKVKSSSRGLI